MLWCHVRCAKLARGGLDQGPAFCLPGLWCVGSVRPMHWIAKEEMGKKSLRNPIVPNGIEMLPYQPFPDGAHHP